MKVMNALHFEDLPPEIRLLIFDKLDFESRVNCSLVCKVWNNLAMSGAFFNDRVVIKLSINCDCTMTVEKPSKRTIRYVAGLLLQSSRQYKAMSIYYMHKTLPGTKSMLNLFDRFSTLTYLKFHQQHQQTHVVFLHQICSLCPNLKYLELAVSLTSGKVPMVAVLPTPNDLAELVLIGMHVPDFRILIQMFVNVPKLCLQGTHIRFLGILEQLMPNIESLTIRGFYITEENSLREIQHLKKLREFTISDCIFATNSFWKWPELPQSVQSATIERCKGIPSIKPLCYRWRHVPKVTLNKNRRDYV